MTSSYEKGELFEREVRELLELKGYLVEQDKLIAGTQLDLIAHKEDLIDNLCIIVECANRKQPIGGDLGDALNLLTLTSQIYGKYRTNGKNTIAR